MKSKTFTTEARIGDILIINDKQFKISMADCLPTHCLALSRVINDMSDDEIDEMKRIRKEQRAA